MRLPPILKTLAGLFPLIAVSGLISACSPSIRIASGDLNESCLQRLATAALSRPRIQTFPDNIAEPLGLPTENGFYYAHQISTGRVNGEGSAIGFEGPNWQRGVLIYVVGNEPNREPISHFFVIDRRANLVASGMLIDRNLRMGSSSTSRDIYLRQRAYWAGTIRC